MTKQEFENDITPKVNNGIGGGVSPEMWNVIEMVYMNTNLTKEKVADIFWNHTGTWSRIEGYVKAWLALEDETADLLHEFEMRGITPTSDGLFKVFATHGKKGDGDGLR